MFKGVKATSNKYSRYQERASRR